MDDYSFLKQRFNYIKIENINVNRFKKGWMAVKPGNEKETEVNGFVIINSDGTKMTIYHLCGE